MCMRVYSLLYTDMSEHEYIDHLRSKSNHLAALFPTLYVNHAVYVNHAAPCHHLLPTLHIPRNRSCHTLTPTDINLLSTSTRICLLACRTRTHNIGNTHIRTGRAASSEQPKQTRTKQRAHKHACSPHKQKQRNSRNPCLPILTNGLLHTVRKLTH